MIDNSSFPLVSVIFPVFGVEKFVNMSLLSIINQKYKNLEIIIVNDGSKDSSKDIIINLLATLNETRYQFIDQTNIGLSGSRNKGLNISKGKYLCFIDSDDIISPNHISNLVHAIKYSNSVVAYSDFEITNEKNRNGKNIDHFSFFRTNYFNFINQFLTRTRKVHCCSLLVERDYLINNDLSFNPDLKFGEDIEFMWRLFATVDNVVHVPHKTYKYLIRKNSLMTNQNVDKVINLIVTFERTSEIVNKKLLEKNIVISSKLIYSRAVFSILHSFIKSSKYSDTKQLKRRINLKLISNELKTNNDLKISFLSHFLPNKTFILYSIFKIEKFIQITFQRIKNIL
jgi:glycosyltransferase involved in cell wall biosynthesis